MPGNSFELYSIPSFNQLTPTMEIDRARCPIFTLLLCVCLLPLSAYMMTREVSWRAHVFLPHAVLTPTDLALHNTSHSEEGTMSITIWHFNPRVVWPIVTALLAYETWILMQRLESVTGDDGYSFSAFGEHAGAFVAHTEFWIIAGLTHVAIFVFTFSPISANFILLFVFLLMMTFVAICEPNNDHGASDAREELITNRIMLIAIPAAAALCIYLTNYITSDTSSNNSLLLVLLAFADMGLILAHSNSHASFHRVLKARMYYIASLGLIIFVWLANHE